MVPKNLGIGALVFAIEKGPESRIKRATIKSPLKSNVHYSYYEIYSAPYTFGCGLDHLFLTEDEAKAELINRKKSYEEKLEQRLKTKEDLLTELFGFIDDENATSVQKKVYAAKIKQFFDIDVSGE